MSDDEKPEASQPDGTDTPSSSGGRRRYPEHVRKLPRYTQDQLTRSEDALGRVFYHTPEGRAVCGRHKKEKNRKIADEACCGVPTGYGPCRVHGAGGGRPWSAGGRHSRVLKKWGRVFDRALKDERILDSKPDIAMMDVVISKLVQRVEQADCPGWRAELEARYEQLQAAIKSRKQGEVGLHMTALGGLITDGARIDQLSDDLLKSLNQRAHTAQREVALEIRREEKVTVNEVVRVFGAWVGVLKDTLDERTFHQVVPRLRTATDTLGIPDIDAGQNGTSGAVSARLRATRNEGAGQTTSEGNRDG